ncbi:MAG: hypothetical protein ACOCWM_03310 [Cyclobacteriaceae bacterium]
MKKVLYSFIAAILLSSTVIAQIYDERVQQKFDNLEQQNRTLQKEVTELKNEIQDLIKSSNRVKENVSGLTSQYESMLAQLDSLNIVIAQSKNNLEVLNKKLALQKDELSEQIKETREASNQSFIKLDSEISKNTLYWIIAVLVVGLLSLLAFILLRKRLSENQTSISKSLAATRKELEQEAIRLDGKLIEVIESQMKIISEEGKLQSPPENLNGEQDHSLALKVADEIVRIEKNLTQMDEDTRGLKQLAKAIARIRDNFAANGYEMVEMVGKPFDDGMKVTANFRPDDSLEPGKRIITRIIKPQVNFKGKMIQSAQIEVSQGE